MIKIEAKLFKQLVITTLHIFVPPTGQFTVH